jgi:CBS domain-containing protein
MNANFPCCTPEYSV